MVVTASTLATDSRLISRSTRSRSSFTRSKMSRADRLWPSLLSPMQEFLSLAGCLKPSGCGQASSCGQQQPAEVVARKTAHFVQRLAAQLRQLARRVHYQRRFVPFTALGNRGEIRRIGFHQDAIIGSFLGRSLNIERLGKRHDSAEAQIEAEIQRPTRFGRPA